MTIQREILYLTEKDVKKTIGVVEAVKLAELGIQADARGEVNGYKFYMDVDRKGFIKPFSGYLAGEDFAFVKIFNFFHNNPTDFNLPTTSSIAILFDAKTGLPVCIMEASWITGIKTAASTTVTARYLAIPDSEKITIFGAGTLGKMHVRALASEFKIKRVFLVDILSSVAQSAAEELNTDLGFPVEVVSFDNREDAVSESEIIITVTTGNQALFSYKWLKPGAFIARLGSYKEIDFDVFIESDKVIVDNWKYVSPRIPELISLVRTGGFGFENIYGEWPDIVAGKIPGRENFKEIILFIALGIWGEYASILPEVFRIAQKKGLGQIINSYSA